MNMIVKLFSLKSVQHKRPYTIEIQQRHDVTVNHYTYNIVCKVHESLINTGCQRTVTVHYNLVLHTVGLL